MHVHHVMRLSPFLVKRSWTVTMPIFMYNVPLEAYMQSFFVCYHSLELPRKNRYCTGFVGGTLLQEHKLFLALEDQPKNGWLTFNVHTWLVSLLEYSFCSFLMSAKTGAAGPFRDVPFNPKRVPCSQPSEVIRGTDSVLPTLTGKAMQ